MTHQIKYSSFLYGIIPLLVSSMCWSGIPVWSIVPQTNTRLSVPADVTATVRYLVKNNSTSTHTLIMNPIIGITQTTTGPGICSSPFTLSKGSSCELVLVMTGSTLQQPVRGGPELCQQGPDGQPDPFLCYQPASPEASLNITPTSTAVLGQILGGGKVACLDGEPYFNLIAAIANIPGGQPWYAGPNPYPTTGADRLDDGYSNTVDIVTVQGAPLADYAAGLCSQYTGGGYHDWFLPAKNQLNCLYTNQSVLGPYPSGLYWSSTEETFYTSAIQAFPSGNQFGAAKDSQIKVRCVRPLVL